MADSAQFPSRLHRAVDTLSGLGVEHAEQPVRLFFQDEARIGLHLPIGRRLTARGVKPLKLSAPIYHYFWLYAAVEPASGDAFWFEFSHLDTPCFERFLHEFSQHYRHSLNLIVLDNAPAHVARHLVVPDNVVLISLPPYCPELNPVERLWQHLKRRLTDWAMHATRTLDNLRDEVDRFIAQTSSAQLASLTAYPYIINAL